MIFLSPYIDSGRIGNLQCAHIFSIGKIIASHLPRIPDAKELKSYLYLVTKSKTIDFIRRWEKRKTSLYPADEVPEINNFDSPDEIALTKITLQKALQALNELPEKYRITLVMKIKGYKLKDIACLTNTSEANVKNRIHRARKYIFSKLK